MFAQEVEQIEAELLLRTVEKECLEYFDLNNSNIRLREIVLIDVLMLE